MPHATLEQVVFRMNALAILEEQGVTVRNRPRSLEVAVDKFSPSRGSKRPVATSRVPRVANRPRPRLGRSTLWGAMLS